MGKFLDFITGGSPKLLSGILAQTHQEAEGDYAAVYLVSFARIIDGRLGKIKNHEFSLCYGSNIIMNYTDIVLAQINALYSSNGTFFLQTKKDFGSEVEIYLRKKGIPELYITGDNKSKSNETNDAAWRKLLDMGYG